MRLHIKRYKLLSFILMILVVITLAGCDNGEPDLTDDAEFDVLVEVIDTEEEGLEDVSLELEDTDGNTQTAEATDEKGIYEFLNVKLEKDSKFTVNIDKGGYQSESVDLIADSDKINATGSEAITLEESDTELHKVTFVIEDENQDPVENAEIEFNEDNKKSDEDGEAVFKDIETGNYSYSVSKDNFKDIKDEEIDVDDNQTVDISLEEITQDITGEGTKEDPFIIYTFAGLEKIGKSEDYPLDGYYELGNDIDASSTQKESYNEGQGWYPIGNEDQAFTGNFDGNKHKITNLYINNSNKDYVGLFGFTEIGGIKDLNVVNAEISGENYVGGIIGNYKGSNVSGLNFKGDISGSDYTGGIIGNFNPGDVPEEGVIINNIESEAKIEGVNKVGGLVGNLSIEGSGSIESNLDIKNSQANIEISGEELVGGIIGYSNTDEDERQLYIEEVSAEGKIEGTKLLGGLIGETVNTEVKNSFAEVDITGFEDNIGGLIGRHFGELIDSYVIGNIKSQGDNIGGLIGNYLAAKIHECYFKGDISGSDYTGGIIGNFNPGDVPEEEVIINNIESEAKIEGVNKVGGLVGNLSIEGSGSIESNLDIKNSQANIEISGEELVGGIIGYSNTDEDERQLYIEEVSAEGKIEGTKLLGGLIGETVNTEVKNSFAEVDITGFEDNIGGLIGKNNGNLLRIFAKGNISSQGNNVGGLVGNNNNDISDSYATGTVNSSNFVGGLVGYNEGDIQYSYSIGEVTGEDNIGGIIGYNNENNIIDSYWDKESSGQNISDGGEGFETSKMLENSTYDSWDFVTLWEIEEGESYPYFQWQENNIPKPQ